jgi:hypothetical protein
MPFLPLIAQDAIKRGDDYQRRADVAKARGQLAEHDTLTALAATEYAAAEHYAIATCNAFTLL